MNYNIIQYTLIFVRNKSKILLGLKLRGLGVDKWNGFGGKIEENETIAQGALRELQEECSLSSDSLKHIGVVMYEVLHQARIDEIHIFTTNDYSGTLTESEEMEPKWFDIDDIPYEKMWPHAKVWFSHMLNDEYFLAHLIYKDEKTISTKNINEYDSYSLVDESLQKLRTDIQSRSIN